jgi:Mg/Co/Ni transporter MgtE
VAIAESGQVASVPVVDLADRLLGVIRHGDLVTATREAVSADIQTMVGVSPDEADKLVMTFQDSIFQAPPEPAAALVFGTFFRTFSAVAVEPELVLSPNRHARCQRKAAILRYRLH